jgi:oligopeptide transport system ATP-binding protein
VTGAPGAPPILSIRDLRVWFPVLGGVFQRKVGDIKAVDGVSLDVAEGETLGLVGESGCGKTTLGRSVIRLVDPTSGSVLFRDRDGRTRDLALLTRSRMRPLRADVQMVFQDPYSSLNPRMTVEQIVEEPLTVHRRDMDGAARRDRVAWLLSRVGLTAEQAHRYPHEFSGGQRQRIGIARALATSPRLVIADEPVSALDVSIQAQVINLLQDLQEELHLTYVFIAHDLAVVDHVSTRIAVMYLGSLAETADAETLRRDPRHPYTRALLSAIPVADPRHKRPDRIVLKGDVPSPVAKPSGCGFRTRCPIARPECAAEVPVLREVAPGHRVACPYV